jgi:hypothetical protein
LDAEEKISQIRDSTIPKERIRKRAEFENEAKNLILSSISRLSWESVDSIISHIDSDFWHGEEVDGRFYPLFCTPNKNRIKTNDIGRIKEFLIAIFEKDDIESIDAAISDLNGIFYGAASVFFYINDSNRYNVFLKVTTKGLKAIYPEEAKELAFERPFGKNYALFNKLCNRLKREFSVEPQELDIILTVLGKQKQDEIEEKKRPLPNEEKKPIPITSHVEAEAILLEIGNLLGYETYTADPTKIYKEKRLGEIASSKEVPEILSNTRNVERTDVIWYNEDMPPSYFFEVEQGGTMRDALHRLYQARHLNARFFIVGPEENRQKFEDWVSTAPYNSSRRLYNFKTFEELSKLYGLIKNAENFKKEFGII